MTDLTTKMLEVTTALLEARLLAAKEKARADAAERAYMELHKTSQRGVDSLRDVIDGLRGERDGLMARIAAAIEASDNDGGSASDAIQDMLDALDPDGSARATERPPMTTEQTTTITCTDHRITSIRVGTETKDEIEVDWSKVGGVTQSGHTVHVAREGHPDIAIVAVDEDAAETLRNDLSENALRANGLIS